MSVWGVISFPYDPPDPSSSWIVNEYLIFNMLTFRKVVLCKRLSFSFQGVRMNCAFKTKWGQRKKTGTGMREKGMMVFLETC